MKKPCPSCGADTLPQFPNLCMNRKCQNFYKKGKAQPVQIELMPVLYSCVMCGLHDQKVFVVPRGEKNLTDWSFAILVPALKAQHAAQSPLCPAKTLSHVKVPVEDQKAHQMQKPLLKESIN